ncbi:MAG: OsmC family peroxiredoxin [Kofleriaceae bacterium]|nr:OsmC family peroxiredoxin [Myxococcales bacterium]MCB9558844.1 OsmC family peroxiredoxin [Kofleriaceae bacterium]MCB9570599.1 OsmC family peroxiredoxin [Kofleriaceae bacterium]
MQRTATAVWSGTGLEGQGTLTTGSGAITDQPYTAKFRFQSEDGKAGTNPEELLGAAHAGCFTMALAFRLTAAGHPAEELRTEARVAIIKGEAGWTIPSIELVCTARVPGIDAAKFAELADDAKANCPISKALSPTITLSATLQ